MTRAAAETAAAADELLKWLATQRGRRPTGVTIAEPADVATDAVSVADVALAGSVAWGDGNKLGAGAGVEPPPALDVAGAATCPDLAGPASHPTPDPCPDSVAVMCLPNPDWLHHRVTITGAPDAVARFRASAAGAGIIPWQLDLDAAEEDWFHRLVAPPAPLQRSLSVAGARILARDLRNAVGQRHQAARTRVGRSRACPFDLHALLPVPKAILRLGPDDRTALAWLWQHWGTTDALRQVAEAPVRVRPAPGQRPVVSATAFRVTFWSRDWTPWRAFARLGTLWPALRFDVQPLYEDG